jgi:hypothetical protein
MTDRRPRIHVWPDRSAGSTFVTWSIGPQGPRQLARSPGVAVDQALRELGGAPEGAIVVIEIGAAPRPMEAGAAPFTERLLAMRSQNGNRKRRSQGEAWMGEAKLTAGARRALMKLSREWQYPSRAGFNAAGAFQCKVLGLAEQELVGPRYRYRLNEAGAARQAAEAAHG